MTKRAQNGFIKSDGFFFFLHVGWMLPFCINVPPPSNTHIQTYYHSPSFPSCLTIGINFKSHISLPDECNCFPDSLSERLDNGNEADTQSCRSLCWEGIMHVLCSGFVTVFCLYNNAWLHWCHRCWAKLCLQFHWDEPRGGEWHQRMRGEWDADPGVYSKCYHLWFVFSHRLQLYHQKIVTLLPCCWSTIGTLWIENIILTFIKLLYSVFSIYYSSLCNSLTVYERWNGIRICLLYILFFF